VRRGRPSTKKSTRDDKSSQLQSKDQEANDEARNSAQVINSEKAKEAAEKESQPSIEANPVPRSPISEPT
jgi:hypothetical protein